jgi:phosphohistidine phosphatase SixA
VVINYRTLSFARYVFAFGLTVLFLFSGELSLADEDERVWAALKEGGKVVLMRHAHVDLATGNPLKLEPGNCDAEVNLSRRGREQAKRIGEAFRARGISVGDVLASPYCRAIDTGMLAFGKATPAQFLVVPAAVPAEQEPLNTESALQLIAQRRGPLNLVMITHRPNIELISLEGTEQGEFVVLKPREGHDFDVVGKIFIGTE